MPRAVITTETRAARLPQVRLAGYLGYCRSILLHPSTALLRAVSATAEHALVTSCEHGSPARGRQAPASHTALPGSASQVRVSRPGRALLVVQAPHDGRSPLAPAVDFTCLPVVNHCWERRAAGLVDEGERPGSDGPRECSSDSLVICNRLRGNRQCCFTKHSAALQQAVLRCNGQ